MIIDLCTHSRTLIAAPPDRVWPLIVVVNDWKQGARLVRQSDTPGLGAVHAAVMRPGDEPQFYTEDVEFVPPARRTIKLVLPDGRLLGFSTWTLAATAAGTEVGYDVYSSIPMPAEAVPAGTDLSPLRRQYQEANQARFDAELEALKTLIEGAS